MTERSVLIGPLTVSFSDDPFCTDVIETMYGQLENSDSPADIRIRGHDWQEIGIPTDLNTKATDSITLENGVIHVDQRRPHSPPVSWLTDRIGQRGCILRIEGWESSTLSIDIYYDGKLYENNLSPVRWALQANNNTFVSYANGLAKAFVYNIFEPLVQGWILSKGISFLHSASILLEENAIVMTGAGGAGKTSSTSMLIKQSDDIHFMSDDLSFISEDGVVYPYNKSSMIYAYNTAGSTINENELLEGMIDRSHWKWRKQQFGDHGVRRRVPPEKLFDGQVAPPTGQTLGAAIYLIREKREQIQHEHISTPELARRSTGVIIDELDWLIEYSAALCSAGLDTTPQKILKDTESVYKKSFADAKTTLVRIPTETGPDELAKYLRMEVLRA